MKTYFFLCKLQQTSGKSSAITFFTSLKALSALRLTENRPTAEWIARTEAMLAVNAILLAMPIMHWTALHNRFVVTMVTVTALECGQLRHRNVTVSRFATETCWQEWRWSGCLTSFRPTISLKHYIPTNELWGCCYWTMHLIQCWARNSPNWKIDRKSCRR